MSLRFIVVASCALLLATPAFAGTAWVQETSRPVLPYCGSVYAPPYGEKAGRRTCPVPKPRTYSPRHAGIGFDILDLESEACFVPDESYQLLDQLIDEVGQKVNVSAGKPDKPKVLDIARVLGEVMAGQGFGLYIPTETLGDALVNRTSGNGPAEYIFDCDIGSLILMTVAENLSFPAHLVDITLSGGSGHNYVRWEVPNQSPIEWDVNGRQQCQTPSNLPPYEGKSMSREETLGYAYLLRAALWEHIGKIDRELDDLRESLKRRPDHPDAYNNLAWVIATGSMPVSDGLLKEALLAANQAVDIERHPNSLDTLACVHAAAGHFYEAAQVEREAAKMSPNNQTFSRRIAQFEASPPQDCRSEN
ncbi:tetratricopeptide repeat protein [Rhizobium leguminosarum]